MTENKSLNIFIAADSTVQTFAKDRAPQEGWGMHLYAYFGPLKSITRDVTASYEQATTYDCGAVKIRNRAIGGRSSRSFVQEGKLRELAEVLEAGDLLLLQFGHNDATAFRPERYVAPQDFAYWLRQYVAAAEEKGAQLVLVTPVARWSLDAEGRFQEDFAAYAEVMRELAEAEGLPLLDLGRRSADLLQAVADAYGAERAKKFFMASEPGSEDVTHLNGVGARALARLAAEALAALDGGRWPAVASLQEELCLQEGAERLSDRGLVALDLAGRTGASVKEGPRSGVFLSWRKFPGEEAGLLLLKKNGQPLAQTVKGCWLDAEGTAEDVYEIEGAADARLGLRSRKVKPWANHYMDYPLQKPEPQLLPDGRLAEFSPNDLAAADLDGDGVLEIVLKWSSIDHDNAHKGLTGPVYLDAYDVDWASGDCRLLWRINLGVNIRAGAHYTQFQLWDYNGDGRAELMVKTADGTTVYRSADGTQETLYEIAYVGAVSAEKLPFERFSAQHDYRNKDGFILAGPEYLTVFAGADGHIIDTVTYCPPRGSSEAWGDPDGNRVDRFLAATAYLDGVRPMAVFCRGYYTRTVLAAYEMVDRDGDGIGDSLSLYWVFDSAAEQARYPEAALEGQGNHSVAVADVDGDGKDEIVYGSMVIDHDGSLLYSTGLGHGDALHVGDWDLNNPGLEIMQTHESAHAAYGAEIHDAATGKILHGFRTGHDTGRGAAGDIDPTARGAEFWCTDKPLGQQDGDGEWNSTWGSVWSTDASLEAPRMLSPRNPAANFTLFWDGDLLPEIQDHAFDEPAYRPLATRINKWNYLEDREERLFESEEILTNNGTKGNMCLVADLLGDWRDEIIGRRADGRALRLYTTNFLTPYSFPTPLKDRQYRLGMAWQNTAYNQPTHRSFLLSDGLVTSELRLLAQTEGRVKIAYTEASDGRYGLPVIGYVLERAEAEAELREWQRIAGKEAGTWTDEGLRRGQRYRYAIRAILGDDKADRPELREIVSYRSRILEIEG